MEQYNGADLLKRYTDGIATPEEIAIVESWQLEFSLTDRDVLPAGETAEDLAAIREKLVAISRKPVIRPMWHKAAAAAVLLLCISAGSYFYTHHNRVLTVKELAAHDIMPGRNTATLTLANGTKIILDKQLNGNVAKQGDVTVTKNKEGEIVYSGSASDVNKLFYNTLSTSNGEQYQVNLPDGSKVWLNAASSLRYASSFNGLAERKVELTGEAYFEITQDVEHPFIVTTQGQEVKVLGTHFNINSYKDEPEVKTTLLEGAVSINNKTLLKPGQESSLNHLGNIHVQEADIAVVMAWRKGQFFFKDVPLQTVMLQIARWYNLEIEYKETPTEDTFNGIIDRNASLSRILKILERGGVRFQIQGRKLIVTP